MGTSWPTAWYHLLQLLFKANPRMHYNLTTRIPRRIFMLEDGGIRGHVFSDEDNSNIIISYKGTSMVLLWEGSNDTVTRDKFNVSRSIGLNNTCEINISFFFQF